MDKKENMNKNENAEVKETRDQKTAEANICGKECEVFSRVVGYYRPTRQWHDGKQEEFRLREEFDENKSLKHEFKNEKTGSEPDLERLDGFTKGNPC